MRYFSKAYFLVSFIGYNYVLAIELTGLSSNWSLLYSCNAYLLCLMSHSSEIHLVLGIPNSLSLFN